MERLQHPNLKILVFSEAMILNEPIEEWPICHCLIAFFSMGFPLEKALAYARLRKPLLINDLESQYSLLDRYLNQITFDNHLFLFLMLLFTGVQKIFTVKLRAYIITRA